MQVDVNRLLKCPYLSINCLDASGIVLGTFPPREQTQGNAAFVQWERPGMVVVGRNQQQAAKQGGGSAGCGGRGGNVLEEVGRVYLQCRWCARSILNSREAVWVCRALDMALPLPAAVRRDLRRLGQRCALCSGVCFGQCMWVKQSFLLGHTTAGCTLKFSIMRVLMLRLRPLCGGLMICAWQHRGEAASVGWSGGAAPRVPGFWGCFALVTPHGKHSFSRYILATGFWVLLQVDARP